MYLEYTILLKNVYFEYTFSHYWGFESEASCDTSLSMPVLEGASKSPSRPSTSVTPTTATKMTRKRFPKKALASEPYIKLDSGEYSEMDRLFRVNGVEPRVRFSIVSDYAAMGMVSAGLGYSVLSGLVLRNAPFDLIALPAEVPAYREIALAQKSSETASGAARSFIKYTKDWIREAYESEPEALLL